MRVTRTLLGKRLIILPHLTFLTPDGVISAMYLHIYIFQKTVQGVNLDRVGYKLQRVLQRNNVSQFNNHAKLMGGGLPICIIYKGVPIPLNSIPRRNTVAYELAHYLPDNQGSTYPSIKKEIITCPKTSSSNRELSVDILRRADLSKYWNI